MYQAEFNNQLLRAKSVQSQTNIAQKIINNPALSPLLLFALNDDDVHIAQRASAVGVIILERIPTYFTDREEDFISTIETTKSHALKRVIFRLLEQAEISENKEGIVYDLALKFLMKPTESIAVRAYCMGILSNF